MNKIGVIVLGTALFLGVGAAGVFADGPLSGKDLINFGKMKPFMQKMHPEMNDQQLIDMYKSCHGTGGAEPSKNFKMSTHDEDLNSF